jgi:hypothetical protein
MRSGGAISARGAHLRAGIELARRLQKGGLSAKPKPIPKQGVSPMKVLTIAAALSATLFAAAATPAHADWDQRRGEQRHRWNDRNVERNLGTLRATGTGATLVLDRRAGRIDDLRLQVSNGNLILRNVAVVFADGTRHVAPVNQQVGSAQSAYVHLPGRGRRIDRIEVYYDHTRQRGGFFRRVFAQIDLYATS